MKCYTLNDSTKVFCCTQKMIIELFMFCIISVILNFKIYFKRISQEKIFCLIFQCKKIEAYYEFYYLYINKCIFNNLKFKKTFRLNFINKNIYFKMQINYLLMIVCLLNFSVSVKQQHTGKLFLKK